MLFKANKQRGSQALEEALGAWRESESILPAERLSPGARANIRVLSRQAASVAPESTLTRLFVPFGRIVAAAGVPALLLALSLGWFLGCGSTELDGTETAPLAIKTSKVNGQAVFEIANGGSEHRVYRADSPQKLADAALYTTATGSFTDTLDEKSTVVYYRID